MEVTEGLLKGAVLRSLFDKNHQQMNYPTLYRWT